jgi:hypothetical protein
VGDATQVAETKQVVHTLEKDVELLEANVQELSQVSRSHGSSPVTQ